MSDNSSSEISLWGDDFVVPPPLVKKVRKSSGTIKSVKSPVIKPESLSLEERLALITKEVSRVLGLHTKDTIIITEKGQLDSYIQKANQVGLIAVDTETNNSLDPVTCKIMGLCLYVPGEKQCYVPVNHVNPVTKERLSNQLFEKDLNDSLSLINSTTKVLTHNGKFDYEVLKCTTKYELPIYWDTLIGAKLLDENEPSAGLKQQYLDKIDPEQQKYSIESLFNNIEYAYVSSTIFALYAATDSFMTYKLYEWQKVKFELPENAKLLNLALTVEMPLVHVIGEMELAGMCVDVNYGKLLSAKYHHLLDEVDGEIQEEFKKLNPMITSWKLTPEANMKSKTWRAVPERTTEKLLGVSDPISSPENLKLIEPFLKSNTDYQYDFSKNVFQKFTVGKSKVEQLEDPINLASPTQLAILFYDILKFDCVPGESGRATGESETLYFATKYKQPICKLLLKRRELVKLLTTYIDVIPELSKRWPDGRIRTHFNQYGAATGRLSSSDPINFQNIPAHNKEIRMLFMSAPAVESELTVDDTQDSTWIEVYKSTQVLTNTGFKVASSLVLTDILCFEDQSTAAIIKINLADVKDTFKIFITFNK